MALLDFLNRKNEKTPEVVPVLPKDIYKQGTLDLVDTIAPTALLISSRELQLGEKFVRAFYTISYPRFLSDSWFSPVINLDKVLDVSIFIHPIETETRASRISEKSCRGAEPNQRTRSERVGARPTCSILPIKILESLRNNLQQAQEKLFDVGLYLALYGDSKEEIDKTEGDIRGILDAKLVYTKPALFQQEQGFRSCLPLGTDELLVNSKLNSSPLSSLFPFVSFDLTSDRGILYGINRHNSSLILFDRFSLENYNSVIFAKSGSGKSYATKLEILRSLMFGTNVIVIDPEREYDQLAESTGGRSFHISLSSEHHINPFDLPPVKEDEDPKDILRSNIIALVGFSELCSED